jgi:transketolase N-terminal domain/subunit
LKTPGIEAGTGSLGQGLSIGIGMALGLKMKAIDRKVYVLIGDVRTERGPDLGSSHGRGREKNGQSCRDNR